MTLAEIEEQARQLSAEDRARLAEVMLESLLDTPDAEIEAAWDREIERRIARFERGKTMIYSADEVFAEARRLTH
jgi:putative addiction module component (TIGR02574 family)